MAGGEASDVPSFPIVPSENTQAESRVAEDEEELDTDSSSSSTGSDQLEQDLAGTIMKFEYLEWCVPARQGARIHLVEDEDGGQLLTIKP
eukprot:8026747-Lingulodinium_polyedra.AAC.1